MGDGFSDDLIRLLPNLKRFALSLCHAPDVADDLVQLTVERAFAARDRFDPATRLEPWLFRILRNAWIDMVRRERTRGHEVDLDAADATGGRAVDGPDSAENRLMLSAVQAAMAELPPEQRAVMHLVCVEELSYAEAAEVLEIPKGTVMSRLARARAAIAARLELD